MNEEQKLPQGWVLATFKDVGTYINGRAFKPTEWEEKGRPILRIQNLTKSTSTVNRYPHDIEEKYIVRPGELLISWSATLGAFIYQGEEAVLNQHIFKVVPLINKHFLFFGTENFIGALKSKTQGSGMQHITKGNFEDTPFPIPPLPEQRRIVAKLEELFSKLDAGVAAVRRTQALLKRYRQSVLHAAVTGELTRAWREAHPTAPSETGAALLQRIRAERRAQWEAAQVAKRGGQLPLGDGWKSKYAEPEALDPSKLPELPTGWTWASMRQLGEVRLGRQRAPQHHSGPHMRPYLRVANVYEDRFDLRDVMEMNFTPEEYETYELRENDILLNEGQSLELVGRPALYRNEVPGACFTNTLVRFRVYQNVLPIYALSVFRSYLHNGEFQKIASWTTSIAHLGADRFAGLHFPLPPLLEQAEIVAEVERRLTMLDALSKTLTDELKRAERLRQSILHQAFTGRLVPQDATDEPAAALLARLRETAIQPKTRKTKETPATPAKEKKPRGRKPVDATQIDFSFTGE